MSRIRSVKPELYRHVELFEAEQASQLPLRLAFTGLFTCCDREGRFRWQAAQLKLDILPYDRVDFEGVLDALKTHGFIRQYAVNGKVYGAIPSWANHQRPSRDEASSEIPAPDGSALYYNQLPTQTLRLQIYERDQYRCLYCEEDLSQKPRSLCLDYVIPLRQKGTHRAANLVTSCKKCNARKANRTPTEADLEWPNGFGEAFEVPSDPLVTPPADPCTDCEPTSVKGMSEAETPLLTGDDLPLPPVLWSGTPLPSADLDAPLTGGKPVVREGQPPYGVEREREGEKEREKEREVVKSKSIVAPARQGGVVSPEVLFVFKVWKTTLGHPQAVLDDKRKALIRQALKSGYSVDQLCQAITGCSLTPYNLGKNDRGQRYDGLHIIFKNADQIDRFMHNAKAPPKERSAADSLIDNNIAVGQEWLHDKLTELKGGSHEIQ